MADTYRGNGSDSDAERLRALGREARDSGMNAVEQGFEGVRDSAAGRARRTGEALRDAADRLEGDPIGSAMQMAADRLDDLSQALRQQDLRGMLDQVQSFAQRQPVLFVGGMMALGFALGRFAAAGSGADMASGLRDDHRRSGSDMRSDRLAAGPAAASAVAGTLSGTGTGSEPGRSRPTATAASPTGGEMMPPRGGTAGTGADPGGRPH
ncbi:hypothetical protein [Caenispirillum bisanense]|uniref:hypothetical protein n=1 Tax=Caenispirillum bisanense TaxID=414052 RepID=UPI0031D152A9